MAPITSFFEVNDSVDKFSFDEPWLQDFEEPLLQDLDEPLLQDFNEARLEVIGWVDSCFHDNTWLEYFEPLLKDFDEAWLVVSGIWLEVNVSEDFRSRDDTLPDVCVSADEIFFG